MKIDYEWRELDPKYLTDLNFRKGRRDLRYFYKDKPTGVRIETSGTGHFMGYFESSVKKLKEEIKQGKIQRIEYRITPLNSISFLYEIFKKYWLMDNGIWCRPVGSKDGTFYFPFSESTGYNISWFKDREYVDYPPESNEKYMKQFALYEPEFVEAIRLRVQKLAVKDKPIPGMTDKEKELFDKVHDDFIELCREQSYSDMEIVELWENIKDRFINNRFRR